MHSSLLRFPFLLGIPKFLNVEWQTRGPLSIRLLKAADMCLQSCERTLEQLRNLARQSIVSYSQGLFSIFESLSICMCHVKYLFGVWIIEIIGPVWVCLHISELEKFSQRQI